MGRTDPPLSDEVEVSLFGPGFGESAVVHLGQNEWLLVDSCLNAESKEPAALSYLRDIGVDPLAVRLVVATHWHDDHIRGLEQILRQCSSADFATSTALGTREFLELVETADAPASHLGSSGVSEFRRAFRLLEARGSRPHFMPIKWATVDRTLLSRSSGLGSKVLALSPTDAAVTLALTHFSQLVPRTGDPVRTVASLGPNFSSVALWVEVGVTHILLGADLENDVDAQLGWGSALGSLARPQTAASVFKVPHHGSANAHNERVWIDLLTADAHALLSPWIRGGGALPGRDDMSRICSKTSNAFITTSPQPRSPRVRPEVLKMMKDSTKTLSSAATAPGQVRLRKLATDPDEPWRHELFFGAQRLSAFL